MASNSIRLPELPEPSCPDGYTLNDLIKHFGLVPGEENPLWAVVHSCEVKCRCAELDPGDDERLRSHGWVHPVEGFRGHV